MKLLTNLLFEPKGRHDSSLAYSIKDTVMSTDGSKVYFALQDVPAGIALTNEDYWILQMDLSASKAAMDEAVANFADYARQVGTKVRGETAKSTGNPVSFLPDAASLLQPVTVLDIRQEGSGDPAPENIRAITGCDALDLYAAGKNLYNKNAPDIINGWFNAEGGAIGSSSTQTTVYIPCSPNTTYTVSKISGGNRSKVAYTKEKPAIGVPVYGYINGSNSDTTHTITTGSDAKYLVAWVWTSDGSTVTWEELNASIQIEIGSAKTEYKEGNTETHTVQIGQTVYGGRMDWLTGKLYAEYGFYAVTGADAENWRETSGGGKYYMSIGVIGAKIDNYAMHGVCSHVASANGVIDSRYLMAALDNGNGLQVNTPSYYGVSSLAEWKAFLAAQYAAGTPVQVAYKLATPIEIQLTPHIISAADPEQTNTLYGDGTIEVEYVKPLHVSIENDLEQMRGSDEFNKEVVEIAANTFAARFESSGQIVRCNPIPGSALTVNAPDAAKVYQSTKNLFLDNETVLGMTSSSTGKIWISSNPYRYMTHRSIIPVKPGETYTLSYRGAVNIANVLYYTDGVYSGNYKSWPNTTITIPDGCNGLVYNLIVTGDAVSESIAKDVQFECGENATDYVKSERFEYAVSDGAAYVTAIPGENVLWADVGNISVSGYLDIQKQITDVVAETKFKEYAPGNPETLYLIGDVSEMSKDNAVTLEYKYATYSGTCSVKWQGHSSLQYPKKNFSITFDVARQMDANISNWPAQKKFCAKANFIDPSHARNIVSAKLWGAIVKSRSTANANLNGLVNGGAVDGYPIFIYINGEFHGLYTMNIPKDPWLFGMTTTDTQQAFVCAEGNDPALFRAPAVLNGNDFALEYSSNGASDWVLTSLNRLINACINSDGTDLDTTVAQYLDWDSAIDYYIFSTLITGIDIVDRNYILVTFDGVKWFFSAYDMDMTFGLSFGTVAKFLTASASPTFNSSATAHRVFELIKTYKKEELKARYAQLRSGAMSVEKVWETADYFCARFPITALIEDVKKWPTIKGTAVNNVAQIRDNYRARVEVVDKWMDAL